MKEKQIDIIQAAFFQSFKQQLFPIFGILGLFLSSSLLGALNNFNNKS